MAIYTEKNKTMKKSIFSKKVNKDKINILKLD